MQKKEKMETKNKTNDKKLQINAFNEFVKEINPNKLNLRVIENKSPFNDGRDTLLLNGNVEIARFSLKELRLLVNIVIGLKNVK